MTLENNLDHKLNCANCASDDVSVTTSGELVCGYCDSVMTLKVTKRNNTHISKRITEHVQAEQERLCKAIHLGDDMYINQVNSLIIDFLQGITNQQIIDHAENAHEVGNAKSPKIEIKNYFNE